MMSPVAIAVLSVSMSADAFAAAIGRGAQHRPTVPQALRSGLVFGVIEAITPLIGFALGVAAAGFVAAIDHWIAFGLLGAVGAKMIWEALKRDEDAAEATVPVGKAASRGLLALIATAVGTSIDAGAVALLGDCPVLAHSATCALGEVAAFLETMLHMDSRRIELRSPRLSARFHQ
jgi:putative Mn2+ efflux pump MntP